jgi:hypothetical protein
MSVSWHYYIPDFSKDPARWVIEKSRAWLNLGPWAYRSSEQGVKIRRAEI